MNKLLCFTLCALLSGAAAGEVYKWVDDDGVTHYSENAPPDKAARQVDVRPFGVETDDDKGCHTIPCQAERLQKQKPAESPRVQVPDLVRGLPFDIFIHIERGMTEAEVLIRTGKPDQEVIEGTEEHSAAAASAANSVNPQTGVVTRNANIIKNTITQVVKTYYYLPTISDPFTTILTFKGGRVADIQRIRKL
ncbi:MAG TPA: DUF4124 domain-containing protein [Burkholderiales bacterium]|nr:DUF4124 domain-containing protein [Burkholderiales bacterium]